MAYYTRYYSVSSQKTVNKQMLRYRGLLFSVCRLHARSGMEVNDLINTYYYNYMDFYMDYADGIAAYWTSTPDKVMVSGPSKVGLDNSWDQNGHAIRYVHDNE